MPHPAMPATRLSMSATQMLVTPHPAN
ncbi:hypothetical protein AZE42_05469 [Rhizopogon vesiculosus]|uniref:Uncharacterized protein n=1 Tax=Rhizopogon vesiculosus TaxID=180088 RepID=A0A1J8PR19_9AGAM|nr:hypothetical protein AZE42_05469 [Rhizopogon vesiculosus]